MEKSQDTLPKTVFEAFKGMASKFNPDEAKDLNATIQFNVSPSASLEIGGDYYLRIADGKCDFFWHNSRSHADHLHTG